MTTGSLEARPPWKWAGGKARLVPFLVTHAPEVFGAYHEPFVGAGAMFWALARAGRLTRGRVFLSDVSEPVVRTFRALRDDVDGLVRRLSRMPVSKEYFYEIRGTTTESRAAMSDVELAAWFLYVNRTAFNGLFRVNRSGGYNVPWGEYTNPQPLQEELFRACAAVLRELEVEIEARPFETVLERASAGEFAYFDPPYLPRSDTSNFVGYAADGFGMADHERLRDVALGLKDRGVRVLLSNSDTPETRALYSSPRFVVETVNAARAISCKGYGRGKVSELVIRMKE